MRNNDMKNNRDSKHSNNHSRNHDSKCDTKHDDKKQGKHKRFFGRGEIQRVLLKLLQEKDMHGYEMIKTLEEKSSGMYKPSPGSIYPTMQMLEDQGYVETKKEDRKTVFSITEAGKTYLEEEEKKHPGTDRSDFFEAKVKGEKRKGMHSEFFQENEEIRKKVKGTAHLLFDAAKYSFSTPEKKVEFENMLEDLKTKLEEFIEDED